LPIAAISQLRAAGLTSAIWGHLTFPVRPGGPDWVIGRLDPVSGLLSRAAGAGRDYGTAFPIGVRIPLCMSLLAAGASGGR
jgi:hypothetical protein